MKRHFTVEVQGFAAGEYDIRKYIERSTDLASSEALGLILNAAFEAAYENPEGEKYCAILFLGHSDRAISGSEEKRRADEERAAQERAEHARSWLLEMLNVMAGEYGFTPHSDWGSVEHVVAYQVGVGATALAANPGTIPAALKNRRLRVVVAGVNVSWIDQNDNAHFVVPA